MFLKVEKNMLLFLKLEKAEKILVGDFLEDLKNLTMFLHSTLSYLSSTS